MTYNESLALRLVGLIYESASEPSVWVKFLEQYSDAVRCTSTSLLLYDTDQRAGNIDAAARVDPVDLRRYNEYYVGVDPWGARAAQRIAAGAVLRGESLCPYGVLERSEFYADFLRPMDVFHQFCGIVALDGSKASVIASLRPRRRGPFHEEELSLLKTLMPHLQRALALHRRLGSLQSHAQSALTVLDRLPYGVLLLSANGRVVLINRSAKAILDQADGLTVRQHELHGCTWDSDKRLQVLMHGAVGTSRGGALHSGGAMSIVRPSGRKSFRVLVTPIHREVLASSLTAAAAIVFIVDPEGRFDTPIDMLAELFALSRAEARLAALLLQDRSLSESARELGVSLNTVRTQLKKLFERTGTNRQGALIRALLLSPVHLTGWSQMPAGERQHFWEAVRPPHGREIRAARAP
jgi:DNA-binding CsgD family transcriptional regulator/PAS domain-containing protein